MRLTKDTKEKIKREIITSLKSEKEIKKIIIFGSFLYSDKPRDIDVAVFQEIEEKYLALAMKYRRLTRALAKKIPIDIVPIKPNADVNGFLSEINEGELIYER